MYNFDSVMDSMTKREKHSCELGMAVGTVAIGAVMTVVGFVLTTRGLSIMKSMIIKLK